jgi:hypothetical protein
MAMKKMKTTNKKQKKQDMQPTFHCNKLFEYPTKEVQ